MSEAKYDRFIELIRSEINTLQKEHASATGSEDEKKEIHERISKEIAVKEEQIRFFQNPEAPIYSTKEFVFASCLPLLATLCVFVALVYEFYSTNQINWLLVFIFIVSLAIILPTISGDHVTIKDAYWENTKLDPEFPKMMFDQDRFYTRSKAELNFWRVSKAAQISFTSIVLIALGLWAFSALSVLTIAPTTIIIILLVVLIVNQSSNQR